MRFRSGPFSRSARRWRRRLALACSTGTWAFINEAPYDLRPSTFDRRLSCAGTRQPRKSKDSSQKPAGVTMNTGGYALLGMTAIVAVLASALTFAVLRFISAARALTRPERRVSTENALLSAALEESVKRLKAQERATAARADASERLSSEIISSLTAGLMVVGLNGEVRIINPAGRKLLAIPDGSPMSDYRQLVGEPTLTALIGECLSTGQP